MRVRSSSSLSGLRTVVLFPVFPRVFAPGLSWLPLMGFDIAGLVAWLILAPRSRNPHSQSGPFSRFITFWRLCEASWSPPLFPRSLRRSLVSCLAALPLPHYRWSRDHGWSSAGLIWWVSALLSAVSWWCRTSCLAQGCVPLLRPFALLLALWSSVPSGSLLLYIAPGLRDEVTLPGWVCLSPRLKRRLFLHLLGVWYRAFAMGSPLRVESFSGLDRNEDSSRTFPSVLVPGLRDEVTLIGSRCVFLRTRSERRLVPSTYPRLLRDGVTLRVECGLSSHSIETKFSLDSWSVFLQDGVTLCGSGSRNLISSEGMPRVGLMGAFFSGPSSGWVSSSFGRPIGSEVGECPAFRCLRFLRGLGLYPSRQHRSRSLTCFYWPCRLSPSPGGSVCFGGLTVIPFTWAFMRWPYTHGGSLAALPKVRLLGRGGWRFVRVPQNLCLTPLPGVRSMLLFLALRYGRCSRQLLLPVAWKPPLRQARDCPSLPLRVAALPLRLSCSEVSGPRILLSYYVARILSCGPGILSSF